VFVNKTVEGIETIGDLDQHILIKLNMTTYTPDDASLTGCIDMCDRLLLCRFIHYEGAPLGRGCRMFGFTYEAENCINCGVYVETVNNGCRFQDKFFRVGSPGLLRDDNTSHIIALKDDCCITQLPQ